MRNPAFTACRWSARCWPRPAPRRPWPQAGHQDRRPAAAVRRPDRRLAHRGLVDRLWRSSADRADRNRPAGRADDRGGGGPVAARLGPGGPGQRGPAAERLDQRGHRRVQAQLQHRPADPGGAARLERHRACDAGLQLRAGPLGQDPRLDRGGDLRRGRRQGRHGRRAADRLDLDRRGLCGPGAAVRRSRRAGLHPGLREQTLDLVRRRTERGYDSEAELRQAEVGPPWRARNWKRSTSRSP
jgi:hypothetical protein